MGVLETEGDRQHARLVGIHRVAFSVDDIDEAVEIAAKNGCHPLRGVATHEDVHTHIDLRGPRRRDCLVNGGSVLV